MLVKLSILLLINRIFLSVNRSFLFWMTQLLIWVNSLFYSIAVFLAIFACRPRKNIWNPDLPGKCLNSKSLYITSASFNTVSGRYFLAPHYSTILVSCNEDSMRHKSLVPRWRYATVESLPRDDNTDSVAVYRHRYAFRAALPNLVFADQLSAQARYLSSFWDWDIVCFSNTMRHHNSSNSLQCLLLQSSTHLLRNQNHSDQGFQLCAHGNWPLRVSPQISISYVPRLFDVNCNMRSYAEIACGLICGCLPILPLFWQHISKGSSGGISLQPVNNRAPGQHSNYTPSKVTRTWDEAYDSRHKPPGRDWVKLEDGTVTKVPDSHLEQKTVDELAVTDAILGNVEEGVVSKAKQAVRHQS